MVLCSLPTYQNFFPLVYIRNYPLKHSVLKQQTLFLKIASLGQAYGTSRLGPQAKHFSQGYNHLKAQMGENSFLSSFLCVAVSRLHFFMGFWAENPSSSLVDDLSYFARWTVQNLAVSNWKNERSKTEANLRSNTPLILLYSLY